MSGSILRHNIERRTIAVKSNNSIGEVGVQTHARRKCNRHIGKQAHTEGSQSRDGGGRGDQVTLDFLHALQVDQGRISEAVVFALRGADAVAARVGYDSG